MAEPLHIPELPAGVDVLTAALQYVAAGFYVGPAARGTKHPGSILGAGWQDRTSRDPEVIVSLFAGTDHGLFLHCGRSGAVVLDVDHPDLLPEVLADALREHPTPMQTTRTGDADRGHYLYAMPPGRLLGNAVGKLGGAWGDVRGGNGVIVVAPSVHRDAADGGLYAWQRTGGLAPLPESIAVLLSDAEASTAPATPERLRIFADTYTADLDRRPLAAWCNRFEKITAGGASRHESMKDLLPGAFEEVLAGLYPARLACERLAAVFTTAAVRQGTGEHQGTARTEREAFAEWLSMARWALARAESSDPTTVLARVQKVFPDLAAPTPPRAPATPCDLDTLYAVFVRWLGKDYDLSVLDAVLCAAAVAQLEGDPAWLLVVSGSGAAKTETVAPLAAAGAHVTSTISSEGALLSGTSRKERSKDATGGLLRKIGDTGVLVIKDVTSVLSMNRDARGAVLAALREVYDGRWERNLGSDGGQSLTWTGRLVAIGAVTTAWDRAHEVIASMGDRFVLIRMDSTTGRAASGRQAIANTGDETIMRAELGDAAAGVLAGVDTTVDLTLTTEESELILALADIVTLGRTGVEHDYRGDVIDAHAPEMPTRFAKQLTQLLRGGLALGMDREHLLRIVARCAADSMPPLRLAALVDLLDHPHSTTAAVRKSIDKPRATVDRTLQALHMLGLLACDEEEGSTGRTVWRYSLGAEVDSVALDRLRSARNVGTYKHPSLIPSLVPMSPCSDKSGTSFSGEPSRCRVCQQTLDYPPSRALGICSRRDPAHDAARAVA